MLYMAYNIPIAHGKNDKNEIKTVRASAKRKKKNRFEEIDLSKSI